LKSFNHLYQSEALLAEFAASHAERISAASDVLITVYSAFLDIKKNRKVLKQVKDQFPQAKMAGATTAGEIDGANVRTNSVLISLHIFQKTKVNCCYVEKGPLDDMADAVISCTEDNTKGILLFPVVVSNFIDIELLLNLVYKRAPKIPVFGGAAGEYGTITQQYCFYNDEVKDNGMVFISFQSDELSIQTDYSFNWNLVGQRYTVTEVDYNLVKMIDNRPAVEVIEENLGLNTQNFSAEIGLEFPLVFKRDNVLIARVIVAIEGDYLLLAAPVDVNTSFQFSFGSRRNALDFSTELAKKYEDQNTESIMAFSCIARLNFLKSDAKKELVNLSSHAGISGFFTYGEIYHTEKNNYYLNETLTLAFFSENLQQAPKMITERVESIVEETSEDKRLKVLTHLTSKVTEELENKNLELHRNNKILRQYSQLIDNRNMEINQSLRYASKLQHSIVFQDEEFPSLFKDHFIYFEPKEEVSGDFYFIRDLGDKIVLAVADGTGHGVPGAFISILGVQIMHAITKRINEGREDLNAGEFLNTLRKKMIKVLDRNRISKFSTDGLDISLIIIDKKSRQIDFSGANQCIIICTENEMIQLKGDRMPVGAFVEERSFSNISITLEENSKVFMYTDGFADQFGGKMGKKLNSAKLRQLIRNNSSKELKEIKLEFKEYFEMWKSDWEQTDDVLLIGFSL
jgi:serine phosphatase RsbU (regulator of sigma subunit)